MFSWDCCIKTFYVVVFVSMVCAQDKIGNNSELRHHAPSPNIDEPETSNVSKSEESIEPELLPSSRTEESIEPELLPSSVHVMPVDKGKGDSQYILQHPTLMRAIETERKNFDDPVKVNQDQDQQRKRSADLDSVIQQVFSPNTIQEYTSRDKSEDLYLQAKHSINPKNESSVKLEQSSSQDKPNELVIIKDGLPQYQSNTFKRQQLLKRLRSPIMRSTQMNPDSENEQNSEELLHNILESIDKEDSKSGNPIKNAFVTKVVTYNISKLSDDSKNKSFLIEKIVNYSTNLHLLHAENIPTNYSDSHRSVIQTILNLDKYNKNSENLEHDDGNSFSADDKNAPPNDFGGNLKLDENNEENNILRTSLEKQDHQTPTEFLGGQYLLPYNKPHSDVSKHYDNENEKHTSSDFVGGQFVGVAEGKDNDLLKSQVLDRHGLDFVGGQYVKQSIAVEQDSPGSSSLGSEHDETLTTVSEGTTTNPLSEFQGLSLIRETSRTMGHEDEPNSIEDKSDMNIIPEGGAGNPTESSKIPYSKNKTMASEGEEDIMSNNNISTETTNEITTYAVESQDKATTRIHDKQKPFKLDPEILKKSQIPNPDPIYTGNYKKPTKAVGEKRKIIRLTNPTETNIEYQVKTENEKITEGLWETTTVADATTLSDDLSFPSEASKDLISSYSSTENRDDSLQSVEISNSSGEVVVVSKVFHQSPPKDSDLKKKGNSSTGLSKKNEDDDDYDDSSKEAIFETQSPSTPSGYDLLSSENEDYTDNSETILGFKQKKGYKNILRTDSATGKFITEKEDYVSMHSTQPPSLEEVEPVSTTRTILESNILSTHSSDEYDRVVGEASDIQQNKLRSQNQFTSKDQFLQDQGSTTLVDDVDLYAGLSTVSESVLDDSTTTNYNSETGKRYSYNHPIETKSGESSEEVTKELCFPLTKKNYPTLLDILSGKLYWEKDGQKVNLELKENPMKNCNSGTKHCKISYDLEKSNDPLISEEMFEVPESNIINKDLFLKSSKNGKRHITEENAELLEPEQKIESSAEESRDILTERTEIRKNELSGGYEYSVPLTEYKSIMNQTISDHNQTADITEGSSSSRSIPVESMYIRLPVPYSSLRVGGQNTHKVSNDDKNLLSSQTDGEKVTLHSLDERQIYDDKITENIHPYQRSGSNGNRLARKIHQKRDSRGQAGGACGCNNPLLLSPNPIPDYKHFVGKRFSILKNIVHTVKDWVAQDTLRS